LLRHKSKAEAKIDRLSNVPFALLLPVDLLDVSRRPGNFPDLPYEEIARKLETAGKLLILEAQMTWVIGNLPAFFFVTFVKVVTFVKGIVYYNSFPVNVLFLQNSSMNLNTHSATS
jgi:hypothetical protein